MALLIGDGGVDLDVIGLRSEHRFLLSAGGRRGRDNSEKTDG
jgi:hypothetical protein